MFFPPITVVLSVIKQMIKIKRKAHFKPDRVRGHRRHFGEKVKREREQTEKNVEQVA